jgi:hypothetical protein
MQQSNLESRAPLGASDIKTDVANTQQKSPTVFCGAGF